MRQHAGVPALNRARVIVQPMRSGALVVACVVAACGGGTGVDIDVFVPSDLKLDRMELWVAYSQCYDCPNGVAWTQTERASGNIYFLRDESVIRAVEQGDRWVLHLDATTDNSRPPWLAIAGFAGSKVVAIKVLRDVHIPLSTVVRWQVDLDPADPATTDIATPPSDLTLDHRAHVWARGPTPDLPEPTGCLAYQRWNPDETSWNTEYFVPASDPDCDGIPVEKECSEYWYQYKPLGRCVTDTTLQLNGTCVVGLSPCADGVTTDRTCGPDPTHPITCAPDVVCGKCSDMIPADTCVASAVDDGIAANSMLHFDCAFDATTNGTPCADQHAILQLPRANTVCSQPVMHYLDRPFTDPQSSLVFGSGADQIKLVVNETAEPCVMNLYWTGGTKQTFAAGVSFLLEVPYSNGLHALYPIEVTPTNQTVTCSPTPITRACETGGPTTIPDGLLRCAQ
jgi:hypothetical protein